MDIAPQLLSERVEDLSPLPELWKPLVEYSLHRAGHPNDLTRLIEKDVALTVRILVVANSEQYGKPGQIATINDALRYLGLDMVQSLILATPCEQFQRQGLYGQRIDFGSFWKHSLACSILCRRIAEKVAPRLAKEMGTAALLHDLGKLLLNLLKPDECSRIIPQRGQRALMLQEQDFLGCTHADAGILALEDLKFPELYRVACGQHHAVFDDLDLGKEAGLITACVSLSDYLTYQLGLGDGGNTARTMESLPDPSDIGLSSANLEEIKKESTIEFNAVISEINPGTLRLEQQFELIRKAIATLGRRSIYLNKNVTELSQLQEIHEDLNRSLEMDQLLEQIARRLGTIFPAEAIVFLLFLEDSPRFHFFSKLPVSETFIGKCRDHIMENFLSSQRKELEALNCEVHLLVTDATEGRFNLTEIRSTFRLPLQGREGQIGILGFYGSMTGAFSQADENLAAIIGGEIALALDRANWMRRTQILSITDDLTRLNNYRRFTEILEHEFGRTLRYKTSMCLLMIDIDRFKLLNDTYGHLQGDRMLRSLADILLTEMRETDMVARYGGEEFAVILPSTDLEGGKVTAERIRIAVEKKSFPNPGHPPLGMTVSVGVAFFSGTEFSRPEEMIKKADVALYRAKEMGRNRTVIDIDL